MAMIPVPGVADWLAARFDERTLARAVVVLVGLLLVTQVLFVWYFGSVGLSLREMGYDEDDRTVVVDRSEVREFARHYDDEREEGWCLYGSVNDSHVRIDDVVHATPLSQADDHIEFTCVRETAGQVTGGDNPRLVGTVHSHPSKDRSRISRVDAMTWGRTSPVVEVMGIYTEADGVEFYTVRSMVRPLAKDVR